MNKIDDFYKKKETLEEFERVAKHYIPYDTEIIKEDFIFLKLYFTKNLNVDKQSLTEIYCKLQSLLEDSDLMKKLECRIIEKLEKELEELRVDIVGDFKLKEEI